MKRATRHKLAFGLIAAIVLNLLFAYWINNGWFESWHLKASNFLYSSNRNQTSEDIVIVAIDNKSFAIRNASELGTLQFNKADYAKALENLEQAGAKAIGIDIIFSEISSAQDQQALANVLSRYDNIILAAEPDRGAEKGLKPLEVFIDPRPDNLGSIFFQPDKDNVVRRQKILFDDPKLPKAFGIKIIEKFLGLLPSDSKQTEDGFQLMNFAARVGQKKYEAITIPADENQTLLINFFGRPNSFQSISFVDAFNGNMVERGSGEALDLTNKIVLIGEMGTGLHDEQYVPNSYGIAMPGIEIHANAIQTILNQRFLQQQSSNSLQLSILLITVIGLATFLFLGILPAISIAIATTIIYMITTWIGFEYGLILNTIYPYMAIFLVIVSTYIFRYFTEAKKAAKTQRAFSRYVSPDVVNKIIENPDQLSLGGEKKELTVFFSDVANFTTIAEQTPPEVLLSELNAYLDVMGEIIFHDHGTLDKFIGDAVMAFWGAPLPEPDHAKKACLSALKCQREVEKFRNKMRQKNPYYMRIGINTGEMVVGNMGSSHRFDYTVIGDSVNTASRLENANKFYDTDILIAERTAELVRNDVEMREVDVVKVKGRPKPVKIYELVCEKGNLTEKQKKLHKEFAKGLKAYREQKWKEAEKHFNACLAIDENDGPSKTFIARCEELSKIDLPKDWDGVFEFTSK